MNETFIFILDNKMRSKDLKNMALKLRSENMTYDEIGDILGISKYSARNLIQYKFVLHKKKRGTKKKISKAASLSIRREISFLRLNHEKVNAPKIKRNCGLTVSLSTVQRYFKSLNLKYKNCSHEIVLSKKHKEARKTVITQWISSNHNWEKTIFSDEKKFSLDGPDCWMTYVPSKSKWVRNKRQCGGGGVMVWLMIMPNGLLSVHIINGKFKSTDYVALLRKYIVPIMRLNMKSNFYFQQDNCAVHKAKIVMDYLKNNNVRTITWPSRSPDLNIVEDVWKIISDMVYDGPQFVSATTLENRIVDVVNAINYSKRQTIIDLYGCIRQRHCKVLISNGNLYNV